MSHELPEAFRLPSDGTLESTYAWVQSLLREHRLSSEAQDALENLKKTLEHLFAHWESSNAESRQSMARAVQEAVYEVTDELKAHTKISKWAHAQQQELEHPDREKLDQWVQNERKRDRHSVPFIGPPNCTPVDVIFWAKAVLKESSAPDGFLPHDIELELEHIQLEAMRATRRLSTKEAEEYLKPMVDCIQALWEGYDERLRGTSQRKLDAQLGKQRQTDERYRDRHPNLSESEDESDTENASEEPSSVAHSLGLRVAKTHTINRNEWIAQNN